MRCRRHDNDDERAAIRVPYHGFPCSLDTRIMNDGNDPIEHWKQAEESQVQTSDRGRAQGWKGGGGGRKKRNSEVHTISEGVRSEHLMNIFQRRSNMYVSNVQSNSYVDEVRIMRVQAR